LEGKKVIVRAQWTNESKTPNEIPAIHGFYGKQGTAKHRVALQRIDETVADFARVR
jgi:hypothetical protein